MNALFKALSGATVLVGIATMAFYAWPVALILAAGAAVYLPNK